MSGVLEPLKRQLDAKIELFDKLARDLQVDISTPPICENGRDSKEPQFYAESFADMKMGDSAYDLIERVIVMGEDSQAYHLIADQIEDCEQRNLDSAVKAIELAIQQCEELFSYKVEASGLVIEAVLPMLQSKLLEHKLELQKSHDSRQLLEASVRSHYATMRDGYRNLIFQVYRENISQQQTKAKLREDCLRWHIQKLEQVIEDAANDPDRLERKKGIFQQADDQFKTACERTFNKLRQDDSFDRKEALLLQLEDARSQAYQWKADIVDQCEEQLNKAEIELDAFYMSHVEELTNLLLDLRTCLDKLYFYDKRLGSLLKLTEMRERAIERRAHHMKADALVMYGHHTVAQLRHPPLMLGTRLKAMALSCGVPPEETEKLLLHILG